MEDRPFARCHPKKCAKMLLGNGTAASRDVVEGGASNAAPLSDIDLFVAQHQSVYALTDAVAACVYKVGDGQAGARRTGESR